MLRCRSLALGGCGSFHIAPDLGYNSTAFPRERQSRCFESRPLRFVLASQHFWLSLGWSIPPRVRHRRIFSLGCQCSEHTS